MLSGPVLALTLSTAGCLSWPPSAPATARLLQLVRAGRLAGSGPARSHHTAWQSLMIRREVGASLLFGCCCLAAAAVLALGGGLLCLPTAAVVVTVGRSLRRRRRTTGASRDRLALGAGVATLRAELLAGSRPADALLAAVPALGKSPSLAEAFAVAATAAGSGEDVAEVLLESPAGELLRPIAAAWRLSEATGAPIASVLARVQADLRDALDVERAVGVAVAGPKSSALMLALLPAIGLLLGSGMGARPLHVLTGSLAGQLLGCAGVLLELAGVAWTARITAAASRW
ncbi:tight adherence protein B [Frankineae bacterium MT45]|nr:tight adherence protein B [Frankineae bacterium MT45]